MYGMPGASLCNGKEMFDVSKLDRYVSLDTPAVVADGP